MENGKEYICGANLLFEGKYLYNSRIKGIKYYSNGKVKYEG